MKRLILFFSLLVALPVMAQVNVVNTISQLEAFNGMATSIHVKDSIRGGDFDYCGTCTAWNDGTSYEAVGKGAGTWKRQTDNKIFLEWFGSNDSGSLQKAADFVESDTLNERYTISAKSNTIVIDTTVTINVKNFNIDLYNAFLVPSETFNGTALVRVIGEYESEEKATCDFRMKFDGFDNTNDIVGLEISTKQVGGAHQYYFTNLKTGLWVHGPCEKQNFQIFGGGCDELVLVEADMSIDPELDYTPNENIFNISAGKCNTYFHDMPLSVSSSIVNFNVENSTGPDYSVILEGNNLAKLRGEIRGASAGGVLINSPGIAVDFESLHFRAVDGGLCVNALQVSLLNGSVYAENMSEGGVTIESISSASILDLSLYNVQGGTALKLGNRSASRMVENASITYNGYVSDSSKFLDISWVRKSNIIVPIEISGTGIDISGRFDWSSLACSVNNINANKSFAFTGTHNTSTINFFGGTTKNLINSFATPLSGMRVDRVTDERNMPAFYDTTWRYQSDKQDVLVSGTNIKTVGGTSILGSGNIPFPTIDATPTDGSTNAVSSNGVFDVQATKADINNPTFTTGITTPAITISGGSTANYIRGNGSNAVFGTDVQLTTIGTLFPNNTPIVSGISFKEAINRTQPQIDAKANKAGDTYTGPHVFDAATVTISDADNDNEPVSLGQMNIAIASAEGAVTSVNTQTGAVVLDHEDVGAAAEVHTHTVSDITDFDTFLDPSLLVTTSTTVELVADSYHMVVVYEGSGDCVMRLPVMAGSDKVRTTIINKTAHTITINTENAGEMWVAGVDTNTTTLLNDKTVEFISDGTQHIKLN